MSETEQPLVFYTDRSAIETDWKCGMRFWWNRKEAGRGIVGKEDSFALEIGKTTHEDLRTIAEMEDISEPAIRSVIEEILSPITEDDRQVQSTMEMLYRRLGWIAAFALFVEPKIRAEFDDVSVEEEIILDRSPLWIAVTPDRVLRKRTADPADSYLVYREYKSTITAGPKWLSSWPMAVQVHLGILALEEELQERIAYGQIMGLLKGDVRSGRLAHPYVWGYYNAKKDQWTHDYEKARGADWTHMPVWEFPGGIVEWVKACGEEVAMSQFPHSPPIFLNRRLAEDLIAARTAREAEIAQVEDLARSDWETRRIYFEQRFSQCRPAFGDACPYLLACFNAEINANPITSDQFQRRTPHHEIEMVLRGESHGDQD